MKIKRITLGILAYALPALALAQSGPQLGNLESLIRAIGRLVNLLIPLLIAVALLVFFWGLINFILSAGDETKRAKAKHTMIWGIIALFVMVSVWGLVSFIGSALGIGQSQSLDNVPTIRQIPQ